MIALRAGVAGLQAIATARRLGAVVHGFDVRAAAGSGLKPGKMRIADMRDVTVLASMPGARVIDRHIGGRRQRALQQRVFLRVKASCSALNSASMAPVEMSMPHSRNCSCSNGWGATRVAEEVSLVAQSHDDDCRAACSERGGAGLMFSHK
jgi:Alanine dehydrogenase/PNT, C-terminal domain